MTTPTINFANPEEVNGYLVSTTKKLRVAIDQIIKSTQGVSDNVIKREKGGREYSLAVTKLEEAKMWLGKALAEFGNQLPDEYRDEYDSKDQKA